MSVDRVQRAGMIVELRKRAVDVAQSEGADAARRLREADEAAQRAVAVWAEAIRINGGVRASSAELAELNAWQRTLRLLADRALSQVVVARAEAERKRAALVAAQAELRKIEVWRDGLAADAREASQRVERRAADELAARTVRRSA